MKTEWVVGGVAALVLAGGGVWYWLSEQKKAEKAAQEKAEAERRAAEERARQERELAAARAAAQSAPHQQQAPAAQGGGDWFSGVLNAVGPIAQGVTGFLGGAKSVLGAFGVKI